jgi:hypothetical protein
LHRSSIGLDIRPQSALLPLGPSCPLQIILLSDLVVCGSQLQKVMALWRIFFLLFEARQTAIIVCIGFPHLTQQVQIQKRQFRERKKFQLL